MLGKLFGYEMRATARVFLPTYLVLLAFAVLSRISLSLYRKMLEYFADNQNPMLNYEYVIEDIGRIYQIRGIMVDDMAWTVIEDQELYRKARERVYPKILKRERLRKENHARETFSRCMGIPEESIEDFGISGGMTNTNFYVKAAGNRR